MSKNELLRERAAVKRDERRRKRKDALRHKDLAFIFDLIGVVLWSLAFLILAISMWHIQNEGFEKTYIIGAIVSEFFMWMLIFIGYTIKKEL